ncbi:MAG: aminotransferase class V-fold PLP-dependent enzyme, partial [Actinomycetota bacterium]|nr:aminotransferase class V-fold PLP-dependent enzyme [Actinomycetota bacterium]
MNGPVDPLELDAETMRRLGYRTVDALIDWLTDDAQPPLRRATAQEMRIRLGGPAPTEPHEYEDILARLFRDVLPHMSRTGHPRFFAFIPGAGTWPGALGDLIASACNVYAGSWMESAGPSQVELELLGWFKEWIGYPADASGALVTGGSAANVTALACAREARIGAMRDDVVAYVGDQAHSSLARAARILGFRPNQLRVLPADGTFRLTPRTLAEAIDADLAAGRLPLFAAVNAGATNTGSVDPLRELAEICRARGVWCHIDAAYGGFAVLSKRGRTQLDGIELGDSIALDPHKWLYQPYECGCLLVRNGHALRRAFEIVPDYLRDAQASEDEVNFADLGLQLSRTSRALKLWISLHAFGLDAFRTAIERSLELAEQTVARIEEQPDLELCAPPSLGVVCFRRRFEGVDDEDELELRNAGLVAALEQSGLGLVSSTRLRGRYAIRLCILNHTSTRADVDRVLDFLCTAEPAQVELAATYERHPTVSTRGQDGSTAGLPLFRSLDAAELAR